MSITDELRKYIGSFYLFRYKDVRESLTAIADRIDAEHEKAVTAAHSNGITEYGSMVAREFVKLPKDADGVPIRVGDELEGYGYPNGGAYCKAIVGDWGILAGEQECNYQRWLLWSADEVRHHHTPTVEDLIRDAILSCIGHSPEYWDEPIAECATKLRLAERKD